MPYRARGATLGAFLVGTVACGALVWGTLFFFSDEFRARVLSTVQELRRWTPESIQQDPIGYLVSVGDRTEELLDRLNEKEGVLALQADEFVVLRKDATAGVRVVSAPLEQLKTIFKEADQSGEWPVLWYGVLRDREWVQEQIVALHRQLGDQLERVDQVDLEANPYQSQLDRVRATQQECGHQLAQIDALFELLEHDAATGKLVQQLSEMEQLLGRSQIMLLRLESEDLPELRPTRVIQEAPVDELVFDSILND